MFLLHNITTKSHLLCLMLWGFEVHCNILVASFGVFFTLKDDLLCKRHVNTSFGGLWQINLQVKWNSGECYMEKMFNKCVVYGKSETWFEQSLGALVCTGWDTWLNVVHSECCFCWRQWKSQKNDPTVDVSEALDMFSH